MATRSVEVARVNACSELYNRALGDHQWSQWTLNPTTISTIERVIDELAGIGIRAATETLIQLLRDHSRWRGSDALYKKIAQALYTVGATSALFEEIQNIYDTRDHIENPFKPYGSFEEHWDCHAVRSLASTIMVEAEKLGDSETREKAEKWLESAESEIRWLNLPLEERWHE